MFDNVLVILLSLGSLGGVVSLVINILKSFKLIGDGVAGHIVWGVNLAAFVFIAIAEQFGLSVDWANIDLLLAEVGNVLGGVVSVITMLAGSKFVHWLTSTFKIPFFGASYSKNGGFVRN